MIKFNKYGNGVNTRDEKTGRFIKGTASEFRKNYDGKVYGDLTVLSTEFSGKTGGKTYCICQCSCGKIKKVSASNLQNGHTTNCGCKTKMLQSQKRRKDYAGQKFNHLLIEEMIYELGKCSKCKCLCDCGKEVILSTSQVVCGNTKSCGCLKHKDYTGQKFNYLLVEEMYYKVGRDTKCKCLCDCGKEIIVVASDVVTGNIKSCGCKSYQCQRKDYTGQKFNHLLVEEMYYEATKRTKCKCLCDCGKEIVASMSDVITGHKTSCGCRITSAGEETVKSILDNLQVEYKQQYVFPDCKYINKLRFDFAILDSNEAVEYLIEYDGQQHYHPVDCFGGEEEFNKTKERDEIKNKYCEENNIPLIRIPYFYNYGEIYNELSNIL